ncbi:MAG: glycosyltransferase [bacterium]
MTDPIFSVIVPVRNNKEELKLLLDALSGQTFPQEKFEILIIDNNSVPPLTLEKKPANCHLLKESIVSSYAARNTGIKNSKGEIAAFIDSDCIPDSKWLSEAHKCFSKDLNLSMAAGKIEVFPREKNYLTAVEAFETIFAFPQKTYVQKLEFGVTANLFVRKKVFEKCGGFDSSLKSGGDRKFCVEAASKGYKTVYVEKIKVHHPARRKLKQFLNKIKRTAYGYSETNFKNGLTFSMFMREFVCDLMPFKQIFHIATTKKLHKISHRTKAVAVLFCQKYYRTYLKTVWFIKNS